MNPRKMMQMMELVAYELAEAETHERKALAHRREAMSLQGAVHAEFKAALTEVEDLPEEARLAMRGKKENNQTTVGVR